MHLICDATFTAYKIILHTTKPVSYTWQNTLIWCLKFHRAHYVFMSILLCLQDVGEDWDNILHVTRLLYYIIRCSLFFVWFMCDMKDLQICNRLCNYYPLPYLIASMHGFRVNVYQGMSFSFSLLVVDGSCNTAPM